MRAVTLQNGWRKCVIEIADRPGRDAEWADRERRRNPEFAREYELVWGSRGGDPVYDSYSKALHERPLDVIRGQTVVCGWDFGFRRPAFVGAQFDSAGRLNFLAELLGEDETIDKFSLRVQALCHDTFGPGATYEDWGDPAGNQRSDRAERTSIQVVREVTGRRIKWRPSQVKQGLDLVRWALAIRDDNEPGLFVDPVRCPLLSQSFSVGYIRDEKDPEVPVKDGYFDHCFAAGTGIVTPAGERPIETVRAGDLVATRHGWRRVTRAGATGVRQVVRVDLSSGRSVICTPDHRIWTQRAGWQQADTLRYADMLVGWDGNAPRTLTPSSSVASSSTDTPTPLGVNVASTGHPTGLLSKLACNASTSKSGKPRTALSLLAGMFTTSTAILSTIAWRTWKRYPPTITSLAIRLARRSHQSITPKCSLPPPSGTDPTKDALGIETTPARSLTPKSRSLLSASSAARATSPRSLDGSARTPARPEAGSSPAWTTKTAPALNAARDSDATDSCRSGRAAVHVLGVRSLGRAVPVYDLSVEGDHEFFANGVLVHNCMDGIRYLAVGVLWTPQRQDAVRREQPLTPSDAVNMRRLSQMAKRRSRQDEPVGLS